jgi:primosomal protein N' (replication factor Y)
MFRYLHQLISINGQLLSNDNSSIADDDGQTKHGYIGKMNRSPHRVRVLLLNAALGPLDYRVPEHMHVEPGSIVMAPLGPRKVPGVVWEPESFDVEEIDPQ